jgi:hypothetical protein
VEPIGSATVETAERATRKGVEIPTEGHAGRPPPVSGAQTNPQMPAGV